MTDPMSTPAPLYLLRVWGRDEALVTALRSPDLREREDDGAFCYWFPTQAARAAFEASWPRGLSVVHDRHDPGPDADGEVIDTRALTVAHVALRTPEGRVVLLTYPFGYGYPAHSAEFMWREGNYSCDCNKRLFIARQDGLSEEAIDALDIPCGDTIALVDLTILKEPLPTPVRPPG